MKVYVLMSHDGDDSRPLRAYVKSETAEQDAEAAYASPYNRRKGKTFHVEAIYLIDE
jgi:hypothetical protein